MIDYSKLKKNKKGAVTLRSLMDFLLYCSSEERWDAFWEIANGELARWYPMSWKTFYKGLQFAYSSGKANHNDARQLFSETAYACGLEYATKKESDWLKKHIDEDGYITLYRGCIFEEAMSEEIGISWTTDLGVAEFFAYRFEDSIKKQGYHPCVLTTKVPAHYVSCILLDRDEDEVILTELYSLDDGVKMHNQKPTEAYEKYMSNRRNYVRKVSNSIERHPQQK